MIYNYPVEDENSTTRYAVDFNDVGTCSSVESNNSWLERYTLYGMEK